MPPRRPRIPTWALAVPVVLALCGAAWLFLAPAGGDEGRADGGGPRTRTEATDREPVEGVLELGDDPTSTEERSPAGTGTTTVAELPALLDALDGVDIAVAPASATGPAGRARIGGVRFACTGPLEPERLKLELQVLDVLEALLVRAGASVDRLDEDGDADCIDERVRRQEAATVSIVLRAPSTGSDAAAPVKATVQAGRRVPEGDLDERTTTLVAELAATLRASRPARTRQRAKLLAATGALDRPGGGATVLVELPTVGADADADAVAMAIARGIAGALVRER